MANIRYRLDKASWQISRRLLGVRCQFISAVVREGMESSSRLIGCSSWSSNICFICDRNENSAKYILFTCFVVIRLWSYIVGGIEGKKSLVKTSFLSSSGSSQ